jgi:hypothetical protein
VHKMLTPSEAFTQLAVTQGRDPELGHQVTGRELCQYTRVDLVGLARQRSDRLDLPRIRDREPPAARLQLLTHPHRAAHHLHTPISLGPHRADHPGEAVGVRGHRPLDHLAVLIKRAPRRPAGTPINPDILHEGLLRGLASRRSTDSSREARHLTEALRPPPS